VDFLANTFVLPMRLEFMSQACQFDRCGVEFSREGRFQNFSFNVLKGGRNSFDGAGWGERG
jgi:hypothetical protein